MPGTFPHHNRCRLQYDLAMDRDKVNMTWNPIDCKAFRTEWPENTTHYQQLFTKGNDLYKVCILVLAYLTLQKRFLEYTVHKPNEPINLCQSPLKHHLENADFFFNKMCHFICYSPNLYAIAPLTHQGLGTVDMEGSQHFPDMVHRTMVQLKKLMQYLKHFHFLLLHNILIKREKFE